MSETENLERIEKLVQDDLTSAITYFHKIIENEKDIDVHAILDKIRKENCSFVGQQIFLNESQVKYQPIEYSRDFFAVIPFIGPLDQVLTSVERPSHDKHGNQFDFEHHITSDSDQHLPVLKLRLEEKTEFQDIYDIDHNKDRKDFLEGVINSYNEVSIAALDRFNAVLYGTINQRNIIPTSQSEMSDSSPF